MSEPRPTPAKRISDLLVVALFLAGIAAPLVREHTLGPPDESLKREFRAARRSPKLAPTVESVTTYPDRFDRWYGDAFGFRGELVRGHHVLKWFVFGVSPTPKVVLGRDDWLFYTEEKSIEVYRGVEPFSDLELEAWRRLLEERRDLFQEHGIRYLYVIGPNKNQIYPEYMPERFDRVGPTRLDQLVTDLKERSDVRILDLRPALLAAKADDEPGSYLYNRLGTHWNARGYLVAYQEIAARLAGMFPTIRPHGADAFAMVPKGENSDSWSGRMYMDDLVFEEELELELREMPPIKRLKGAGPLGDYLYSRTGAGSPGLLAAHYRGPSRDEPIAIVFHDSFLVGMRQVLATHFADSTFLRSRPFLVDRIAEAKIDLVMELFVERHLVTASPFAELPMDQERLAAEFDDPLATRFRTDDREPPWGLSGYGGAEVEALERSVALRIRFDEGVLLPELPGRPGERRIIRAQFHSPAETELELAYETAARPGLNQSDVIRHRVRKGRNQVFLELSDPTLTGRVLFRPGRERGRYMIVDLNVRAVGPR